MIHVQTNKMPNGKWSCFATFNCYDYSFIAGSKEDSQKEMSDCLKKHGMSDNAVFMKEVEHLPYRHITREPFIIPKIDHHPQG